MINQSIVGQYLDRDIYMASTFGLLSELTPGALEHAAVFYWLPRVRMGSDLILYIQKIVSATPLVLFLAGPGAHEAFDALLRYLSSEVPPFQIMTKSNEASLHECLEELWEATWPSEDRFDAWTNYLIVASDEEFDYVKNTIVATLRTNTNSVPPFKVP